MKDRFLSGDRPILFLLLFNIVAFIGIFLYDYTRYGYQGSQKVIGSILYKSKTIQRKYDSEVVWKEIEIGNSVQNRDTILTSEGSQAKIVFLDGSEIVIAENSMIFIDYLDNRANLEISSGGLQVTRKSDNKETSLGIRSGDGVLKLVEGVVNVEKKKNQKTLDYAILSGVVKADPSNPFPMLPKKSLDGFEKLFPVAASIQTAETLQAGTTADSGSSANTGLATASSATNSSAVDSGVSNVSSGANSNPSNASVSSSNSNSSRVNPNHGTQDNGKPNYTGSNPNHSGSSTTPDANSNVGSTTTNAGGGTTGFHTKSGLKTERTSRDHSNPDNKTSKRNVGNFKPGYDPEDYIQKQKYEHKVQEKSDSIASQKKTEFKDAESAQTQSKGGNRSASEVKKQKPSREWTAEELLRQEKEKRRREREDKEQREFLRM
ncbi:sigma factor regulatory protein, FecR/PupR family [Leptospira weilii serovar Ranarum str. ICFT]|uniref:Sigma factor regulatory protein, FecR/PupR family n=1 Tax=Leptospira weilii serovar Ranarum str. ICFT TaxID=1218598 RepID=N1WNC6_9LEPT|nr:FecR family protein [Leptospira weilii]EMY78752.1 sigma factor regulatory protein, FecR/PupR family [Leptospira weilii serovar Ranarum str. ICFT]